MSTLCTRIKASQRHIGKQNNGFLSHAIQQQIKKQAKGNDVHTDFARFRNQREKCWVEDRAAISLPKQDRGRCRVLTLKIKEAAEVCQSDE